MLFVAMTSSAAWTVATRPPRAATVTMAAAGAGDATAQLCAWVESQGGSADNIVVCQTPYGLGLLAARPIKKGEAAVRVPESCLLSATPPEAAPALTTLQAEVPPDFWAARLGLALLAERAKGEDSQMREYVATLPAAFTVPLFWSPEAVGLLAYPTVRERLLKTAKFVDSFAREQLSTDTAAQAFGGVAVGTDALGWAVAACSSRAYAVRDGARVLCPIIDLGNHAPRGQGRGEASCEVRGTAGGAIELVALRSIAAGEEVSYCYGGRRGLSNGDFLLDYGFIPLDNPHDDAALAWSIALLQSACDVAGIGAGEGGEGGEEVTQVPWRAAALRSVLPARLEQIRITRSGVCEPAMQACRIAAASDAAALRKSDGGRRALPPAGEASALTIASAMAAIALTALPPPEEAEEAGEEGAASPEGEGKGGVGELGSAATAAAAAAAAARLDDGGTALARAFVAGKREVCTQALAALAERISTARAGGAKAAVRGGGAKAKQGGAGVRKRSANRAGAAERPKASGFG